MDFSQYLEINNFLILVNNFWNLFVNQYTIVEKIFVVIVILMVIYTLTFVFIALLKLLYALKSFLLPKGMGRQLKVIKNKKLSHYGSKTHNYTENKDNVGFWETLKYINKARKLALIERSFKKDKPIKLSLTESIFLIQNYSQYNFFASEDGKVLFEKVRKEIEGSIVGEETSTALTKKDQKALKLLGPDRLKTILKENTEFILNANGNIIGVKDKDAAKEKVLRESVKKIEKDFMDLDLHKENIKTEETFFISDDRMSIKKEANILNNNQANFPKKKQRKKKELEKSFKVDDYLEVQKQSMDSQEINKVNTQISDLDKITNNFENFKHENFRKETENKDKDNIRKTNNFFDKFLDEKELNNIQEAPNEEKKKQFTIPKKPDQRILFETFISEGKDIDENTKKQKHYKQDKSEKTKLGKNILERFIEDEGFLLENAAKDKRLEFLANIMKERIHSQDDIKVQVKEQIILVKKAFLFKALKAKDLKVFELHLTHYKNTISSPTGESYITTDNNWLVVDFKKNFHIF